MLTFIYLLSCFLSFTRFIAGKIDRTSRNSWWLLLMHASIIISVSGLGLFSAFTKEGMIVIATLLLIIQGGWMIYERRKKRPSENSSAENAKQKTWHDRLDTYAMIAISIGLIGITAWHNLVFPLAEIDSVGYHLPIMQQLIDTQSVWNVFHAAFVGPNTFFPANHEAIQAFISLFTETTHLNFIITLSGIFLFYLALTDLTREKKIPKTILFLGLLAITTTPFLFKQLLNFQIDLYMFCLFGSAVCWLLASIEGKKVPDLAKSFIALGILIGTKYNGLPETLILTPLIIFAYWRLRNHWKQTIWLPLLSVATGATWYIRNAVLTGNPLYPFPLNIGPIHWLGYKKFGEDLANTSIFSALQETGLNSFREVVKNPDFPRLIGKWGVIAIISIIILSTVIATTIVIVSHFRKNTLKNKKTDLWILIALLFIFIGEAAYYMNSPYTFTLWNQAVRYAAPVYSIIAILLVVLMRTYKQLVLPLVISALLLTTYNLSKSFIFDQAYIDLYRAKSPVITSILNVPMKMNTPGDDIFVGNLIHEFRELRPFLKTLRKAEPGTKVGLVGLTAYYLFDRENLKPMYINIDGCLTCKYYEYQNQGIREKPNEQAWIQAVKASGIRYLIVSTNYKTAGEIYEKKWAEQHPEIFEKIDTSSNGISLFSIKASQ